MRKVFLTGTLALALPCFAAAQVAILQIQVVEGEAAVHKAGARSARPLTVEVTDETGRPVGGATVSFRLPDEGPGGVFSTGIRTELVTTDSNGRASIRSFQVNRTSGPFQIRITASKDTARAGTFSRQYIAGARSATGGASTSSPHSHRKWLVIGLAAGAVAAAGLAAGMTGASSAAPAAPGPPPLSIGTPVITIGRP